jgi:hypothetical protein
MIKHFSMLTLKAPLENLFELETPDSYQCRVFRYELGHSWMTISAHDKNAKEWKPLYIHLGAVRYFEGPMWWEGANFCVAPIAEYLDVCGKVEGIEVVNQRNESISIIDDLVFSERLFTFKTNSIVVKIIASFLTVTDEKELGQ